MRLLTLTYAGLAPALAASGAMFLASAGAEAAEPTPAVAYETGEAIGSGFVRGGYIDGEALYTEAHHRSRGYYGGRKFHGSRGYYGGRGFHRSRGFHNRGYYSGRRFHGGSKFHRGGRGVHGDGYYGRGKFRGGRFGKSKFHHGRRGKFKYY